MRGPFSSLRTTIDMLGEGIRERDILAGLLQ
jgi:hypothetical protein